MEALIAMLPSYCEEVKPPTRTYQTTGNQIGRRTIIHLFRPHFFVWARPALSFSIACRKKGLLDVGRRDTSQAAREC